MSEQPQTIECEHHGGQVARMVTLYRWEGREDRSERKPPTPVQVQCCPVCEDETQDAIERYRRGELKWDGVTSDGG